MRYTLALTCPRCGHDVTHVTAGTTNGTSTRAVAQCEPCRDEWLIEVRAVSVRGAALTGHHATGTTRNEARCGTDSGYKRHRRLGEPTCEACRAAHSRAVQDSKRRVAA